jgi:ethanolamine permease
LSESTQLKRVLRPVHLWAIAVGLVISGDYVGWNIDIDKWGPMGLVIATLVVSVLYVCFVFSYTELTTAIPSSGGPFAYAERALGPWGGYVAGFATLVDFILAPPAIARGIGDYVNVQFPSVSKEATAVAVCLLFGALNVVGVGLAAIFELVITTAAVTELVIYFAIMVPHGRMAVLTTAPMLPMGWQGVFEAVPIAIWLYLGIEGVAMSAEEVVNPRRDIPIGYIAGIATLVVLAIGTLVTSAAVLPASELAQGDKPLLNGLRQVMPPGGALLHLMAYFGLFGLVASLHGLIMGASRQVYALAWARYLPTWFSYVHPRLRTPVSAIVLPAVIGAIASQFDTDKIIAYSVLGAVVLYIVSMVSLFVLRVREPALERPFRAPFYPVFPAVALVLSCGALVAVCVWQWAEHVPHIFVGLLLLGLPYCYGVRMRSREPVVALERST